MCLSLTLPHRYRPSDLSVTRVARWWLESAPTHIHGKPHTKPSEVTFSSQCKLFTFLESTSVFQNVHKNTRSGVAWSQSLSFSLSRATMQWKLDRSPGAVESFGVQPRVFHHKALPCYVHQLPVLSPSYCFKINWSFLPKFPCHPKTNLLTSSPYVRLSICFQRKVPSNHQILSYLTFPWSLLAFRRSL
jgi:hypothetical protein